VLRSRAFGEIVVRQLNLTVSPESIAQSITTQLVPNTNIFRLTLTWDNPTDAEQLAQAIAEIFVSENMRRQGEGPSSQSRLAQMDALAQSYPQRIDAARQQRDRLDQVVSRGDLSRLAELNNLESRLASLETSYSSLLVEISRIRSSFNTASILDRATPAVPTGALPPSRALLFGLACGLALAVGLAFLLERLDDTIRGPRDVVTASGTAPLVTVGRIPSRRGQPLSEKSHLVAVYDCRAPSAEPFRVLRANLRFASPKAHSTRIVVTSAGHGEGKTLVACNLAVACAQAGDRVLLVDANLREPSIHRLLGVSNERGYVEALVSGNGTGRKRTVPTGHEASSKLEKASTELPVATAQHCFAGIVPNGVDNLSLLLSGPLPSDPAAVLGCEANGRLMERLGELWDLVIFDTTPLNQVADTRMLAAGADAVLLVARAGATSRASLQDCLKAASQTGRPVLGVVLNDFRPGPLARHGGCI
jgi:Mrp family chromosome partitioning ATPase